MTDNESPLKFPCRFPIKIFASSERQILMTAREIVERHVGPLDEESVTRRDSKNGKYEAITFTVDASSKAQLDALYRELTALDDVLMAL